MAIKVNAPNQASFRLDLLLWRRKIADSDENKRTQSGRNPNAACAIIDDGDRSALNGAPFRSVITAMQSNSNRVMLPRLLSREACSIGLTRSKERTDLAISYLWESGFVQRAIDRAIALQEQTRSDGNALGPAAQGPFAPLEIPDNKTK
ncbi:MAG: hypothetical protein J0I13_13405 [Rhizobiales bacterium]|nr:hypothetical protein [Hyphomicrobiales bacterium]